MTLPIEDRFEKWIETINRTEKIEPSIIGFNFGLLETTEGFEMYLMGSKSFSLDDEDWALDVDFEPTQKYFQIGLEANEEDEDYWEVVLNFSENLVKDFIGSEKFAKSFLSQAHGITVGFDEGELSILYLKG